MPAARVVPPHPGRPSPVPVQVHQDGPLGSRDLVGQRGLAHPPLVCSNGEKHACMLTSSRLNVYSESSGLLISDYVRK